MVERTLFSFLKERAFKGKAIVIIGPRQTGKTTVLKKLADSLGEYLHFDGDDPQTRELLTNVSYEQLRQLIGAYKVVFIDEAQRIINGGLTMKMIIDRFPDVQLLVSGSSALELGDSINEPLTGRKWEFNMFPISWEEWQNHNDFLTVQQQLESRLIYGMYPDVLNNIGNEVTILKELSSSYLYKDILALSGIRKPTILQKLVQALALQCGSEVSLNELSQLIGIDKNTVSNYIDLLEKTFVVFTLPSLNRNVRNEIKHNRKVYFYDNGIRNAVIDNFNPIHLRQDLGALWENFLISERMKRLSNHKMYAQRYFWRTTRQQEIDYVEESNGQFNAFEFKWNPKKTPRIPASFMEGYDPTFEFIHRKNFTNFLIPSEIK